MLDRCVDRAGAGILDAKKALGECEGDMEKAMEWLKKKGMAKADARCVGVGKARGGWSLLDSFFWVGGWWSTGLPGFENAVFGFWLGLSRSSGLMARFSSVYLGFCGNGKGCFERSYMGGCAPNKKASQDLYGFVVFGVYLGICWSERDSGGLWISVVLPKQKTP